MKLKYLLLAAIFLNITLITFAQEDDVASDATAPKSDIGNDFKPFRIGIFGDADISWMAPKMDLNSAVKYTSDGSRIVAGWGLFVDWNFTENYSFSTGFRFGGSGGKLKFLDKVDTNQATIYRKYDLRYLDIPLNLKLKTNQIGYFTYFFQIGISPGFRLSAEATDKFEGTSLPNRTVDLKSKTETSFLQLGFNVGIGSEYQVSKTFSAFALLGYRNGLIDALTATNGIDPNLKENAYIRKIALSAGFLF